MFKYKYKNYNYLFLLFKKKKICRAVIKKKLGLSVANLATFIEL